jgi:(E)-4-hydroxy-3-methylbut-2-enyl-diphosphate synthase
MAKKNNTREVNIKNILLGGNNPIRIQSMTSTLTQDIKASVAQIKRVYQAGGELIRLTTPTVKDAESLQIIRKKLERDGIYIPIIADVHFSTKVAEAAALYADKVRINPGNYSENKKGKTDYSKKEYQDSIQTIKKNILPLITICKKQNTAIRIGSNHGSLSQRILSRYGNTPEGMVEGAMEFLRIFNKLDFNNLVISMKASNVKIMVQANRLLIQKMQEEEMNFPIHLGVTEAGDGEDGRIKSAAGIGILLVDGIGDTIRVSLTEDPEYEIPVAKEIIHFAEQHKTKEILSQKPIHYSKRKNKGMDKKGQIAIIVENVNFKGKADFIAEKSHFKHFESGDILAFTSADKTNKNRTNIVVIELAKNSKLDSIYQNIIDLRENNPSIKIVLKVNSIVNVEASIQASYFLIDGLLDGLWMQNEQLAFDILQATGERISKTEYIACPSCGRTLFNIQTVLQKIKRETQEFKGLKIGVMGCIVNGPGEMADADYGYVGAGHGRVHLYKGQEIVKKNIEEKDAINELLYLINQK